MKKKSFLPANPLSTMVSAGFMALSALLVAAGGGNVSAATTALHITNTGKNTEALPTYRLDWVASSNATYLVQSTTSLVPGTPWTTLDAVTPVDQVGSYQLQVTATDSTGLSSPPATFYRLILPSPRIFSVEPAIVAPGGAVDFSVFGQAFPANAVLKVNGVTQAGAVVLSSSLATVPSFTPDVAGNYQFSLVISGSVVSSFTVTCADPLTNPELVLQGPPTPAPAAPIAFWLSKKGYDYYKAQSDYSFDIEQTLNIGSQSSGAGAGKVTFNPFSITRKIGSQSSGAGAGKVTFNPFSITRKSSGAGGGGGGMTALMKAKEKANQCKSMAGVQPFSGEVQECDVDLAIPGRSLDFVWARTYHSRIGRTGAATNGWTFSYDINIQPLGGDILIHNGTGRADTFKLGTSGTYTCPEFFSEGTLAGGVFRLTFADTGYWEFNPLDGTATAGKLAHIVDRNGNTMSLNYDTGGRLAQVVDDLGRTNTVAYDTAGRVAAVTDFTGRSVTYQYYSGAKADNGSVGDLKSVTSPPVIGTPNGNDFPTGKTTTYTYSKSFPLDRENHLLLTVTDSKGQTAAVFTYEHTPASPNYLRCVAAQCGSNPTFTYSWSLLSRPAGSTAVVKCIVNDPVGNVTEDSFDARGRCVIARDYTGRATPGVAVTDTVNRPTGQLRSTDPAYYEARWSWNNDSLCTLKTAPGGQQVQCVYQSDFDPSTTARKRADCRVVRELATSPVDLDGDGVADVTSRATYLTYDPRFGSDPTAAGKLIPFTFKLVAVKTCSWAHDDAQDAAALAFTFKLVAVKTISWAHDDESPKETVTFEYGGADSAAAAAFTFKLVAVKTISWAHDDESPKETVTHNNGGADAAAAFTFKLVAVKTISWAHDDESPKETVTFEYGGLAMHSSAASFTSKLMAVNALGNGMAIKTKGTGADKNRIASAQPKIIDNQKGLLVGFCVSATDPRGDVTTVSYDTKGNPTTASSGGVAGKVTFNPFSITRKIDCAYDTFGQLVAITNSPDANGRRRVDTFAWSQGRVTQCVADAGAGGVAITSAFEYDPRGNLTRAIDPRGNDCLFTYNALDQCVRAQSPPNITSRCTTDLFYDANDNLVQSSRDIRDAADNLVGTQVDRASYNGQDCLSEMALAMDASRAQTNRFIYDGNNQCVQVLGPDAVSSTDPHQAVAYEYDERGLLFRAITAPGSPLAGTNELSYTANYNPATKKYVDTEDALKLSVFSYDGFDRLSGVTDPMGNQAVCFYDANDNPKVVRLYGELNDVPGSAGNVRLSESSYEYDGLDRLFRAHDLSFNPATQSPIGSGDAVSTCVLAPNDECVSVTDSLGRATSFAYDTACRLSSVTSPGSRTLYARFLDAAGNVTQATKTDNPDLGGSSQVFSISFAYDHFNRCVSSSDNVGNTSTCAYDSLSHIVRATNPNGNDTTCTYDLLDDCLASTDYAGSSLSSGTPPTIVRSISATYDTSLRCLTSTDPNGNTTSYAYDSLGNCVTVTEADGTQQQLVWSPRSNLIQVTDANNTTISNSYDLLERLVHRDIAARGVAVASTTFENFAYDGSSRLVLANNYVSSQSFSYDSFGDCTASSQDGLAQSATYDSAGNPLSLTYPSGRVVTYAYDVLDQVTNVSTSANGVSHPQLARFAYAGPGRLARIGRDNGLKTQIDWDGLANPGNNASDYGWQEVSRVRDGSVASPSLVCDVTGSYSRTQSKLTRADAGRSSLTLTYDALEQLVEASDSVLPRDTVYALDAAGNRSHVITNGILMTPDYAMSSALPPGDFFMNRYTTTPFGSQQYDANGNLVVRATAASPTFYHYDYADRLVEVDALGTLGTLGPVATFTYDALGNRISKTTYPGVPAAPVTVQYVRCNASCKLNVCGDGNNIIEERVGTSVSRAYCDMTAFTGTGAAQYYHCDDLGNVLALTDAGGNVLERYAYDDYGRPQFLDANGSPLVGNDGQPVTTSPLGNPILFQGMEWDGESGLLGDGDGNYFDPLPASAIRGKVKVIKDMGGSGRGIEGNNPWSGGGGGGGWMQKGTVKFFNDAKGFGFTTKPKDANLGWHVTLIR